MTKTIKFSLFSLLFLFVVACSEDDAITNPNVDITDPDITIWTGPTIAFEKLSDADPNDAQNQDRLTSNVSITRGNNGGQIYNVNSESSANKEESPKGTLWAIGTTDNMASLNMQPFRAAVGSPKDVVGKNLVLFLESEKIALNVKFTSWSTSKGGGFSYERSSPN